MVIGAAEMIPTPKPIREPLAVGIGEACRLSGLGKTTVFSLISEGRLRVVKVRKRTLISYPSLKSLLEPSGGIIGGTEK